MVVASKEQGRPVVALIAGRPLCLACIARHAHVSSEADARERLRVAARAVVVVEAFRVCGGCREARKTFMVPRRRVTG